MKFDVIAVFRIALRKNEVKDALSVIASTEIKRLGEKNRKEVLRIKEIIKERFYLQLMM